MFCPKCGSQANDTAQFCTNCGANLAAAPAPSYAAPQQTPSTPNVSIGYAGSGDVRLGIPAPGFSDRVNHPEILAAVKKNRKAAGVFAFFLVPLPFIGFLIYGLVSDKMEMKTALIGGAVVSLIFLVFALFGFVRERAANSYEGVVVDKRTAFYRTKNASAGQSTRYITYVQTTSGKKKKIVEHSGSLIWAYNYLNVGDRFRYHPQFHFPYERYDKAGGPCLYCVSCGTQNDVEADRCKRCGLPLLK